MMRWLAAAVLMLALVQAGTPAPAGTSQAGAQPAARERAYRSNNVGVAYLEQFNYQEAERAFREALDTDGTLSIARLNLAIAVLYAGRAADALVEARDAAQRMPDAPQAHFVRGLAAKADDQLDEAVAGFERVLALDPTDPATRIHLGQIHLQQRRYPEALRLFQEALAAEPYNVTAAYNVALALTRSGQAEQGRAEMQRFETLRDSPYGVTFAQTYLSQGRYAEAMASTGAEADLVDRATPAVTFADVTAAALPAPAAPAGARLTAFDADGDGDLDLLQSSADGLRFLRNDAGSFKDETAASGLALGRDVSPAAAVAGDYDNDGRPDLVVLGKAGLRLLHQSEQGRFEDVTARAALPAAAAATTAALVDIDHDGDVDIVAAGAGLQLLQNNGNGTFTDVTEKAGLSAAGGQVAVVAGTDFDNRRDVDLVVAHGTGVALYRNMRDGSFRDWSKEAGLGAASATVTALTIADVNKDGYPDLFFNTGAGWTLASSDGQARFKLAPGPAGIESGSASQFVDYDNDGLLDLLVAGAARLALYRNVGQGQWVDVSDASGLAKVGAGVTGAGQLVVGDLDGDGDADIAAASRAGLRLLRNEGGSRHASVRVRLAPRVSNRSGAGAKIEMRAGSLRQMLETSASSPAVAPADVAFGLGSRQAADVVRVLWPSGILQAETELAAAPGAAAARAPLTIAELDRKPSSCPYLFTWNGSRFEFVTDFMGGGEMGGWQGPGVWGHPDPDEYVRIRGDQLQARDGRYELRITNELEETLFVDRLRLYVYDHEAGAEIYPNEGLRSTPAPLALTEVRSARVPRRAVDEHGHDVLPRIARMDRRYPDDFGLSRVRGYAADHELVIDVGPSERPVLLLTGWTDYAFSSDNVAASQGGARMSPPALQVKDEAGRWVTAIDEIGFPVGRPQTVAVDLTGRFKSASREVRIVTNMRVYWDQILVADRAPSTAWRRTLDVDTAVLRWRGYSAEVTPDGREPFSYDYDRVSSAAPWKTMIGAFTREGDVRPLVRSGDDRFVVSRPGDEIAVSFAALPPPAPGMSRTFLLYAFGYSKEMNPRSAVPDTVGPMPFRAMSGYPYGPGEQYPDTPGHRRYRDDYNTRIVTRSLPSIDLPVGGRR